MPLYGKTWTLLENIAMDGKEFKKWLENEDKNLANANNLLEGLGLEENVYEFLQGFVENKEKVEKKEGAGKKIEEKARELRKVKVETVSDEQERIETSKLNLLGKIEKPKFLNKNLTFAPEINKKSSELAKKLGSFQERLLLSLPVKKSPTDEGISIQSDSLSLYSHSFSSKSLKMNSDCSQISKNSSCTMSVLNAGVKKLHDWDHKRVEKQKKVKQRQLREELVNCTFVPQISQLPRTKTIKKPALTKPSYSCKRETPQIPSEPLEKSLIFDLTTEEYTRALKRLHWELDSMDFS